MTDSDSAPPPSAKVGNALELAMRSATEAPSQENLRRFYTLFRSADFFLPVFSPSRPAPKNRQLPLSPFSDLLSLEKNGAIFVPAFTSKEELLAWSREELETRTLSGAELCKRVPETIWISINPEGEFGKELSPWEVERLRDGAEQDIKELIAEIQSVPDGQVHLQHVTAEQSPQLMGAARELRERFPEVTSVFAGLEMVENDNGALLHPQEAQPFRYLIGVEHRGNLEARDQTYIYDIFSRALVGDLPFKIFFGVQGVVTPEFAIFYQLPPLLSRTEEEKTFRFWDFIRKLLIRS